MIQSVRIIDVYAKMNWREPCPVCVHVETKIKGIKYHFVHRNPVLNVKMSHEIMDLFFQLKFISHIQCCIKLESKCCDPIHVLPEKYKPVFTITESIPKRCFRKPLVQIETFILRMHSYDTNKAICDSYVSVLSVSDSSIIGFLYLHSQF